MKPRIAMIGLRGIPASDGGVEVAITELAPRLVALGADVTVYGRKGYLDDEKCTEYKGVHIKILPTINSKHLEAIAHTFLSTLHATFQGYDIIHYHALGNCLFAGIPRLFGKTTMATMHGLDWQRGKWGGFAKFVLRLGELSAVYLASDAIAVSQKITNYVKDRYGKDIHFIPNGFSSTDANNGMNSDVIEKNSLSKYVLFLGRLVPEKGIHLLIESFSKLDTDHQLVIAGRGTHTSRYVDQLKEMAAEDSRIIFTGGLYGADKETAFNHASVFVLPSTIEGMPIALLEAMSHGIPCVVSDIQENREVVETGQTRYAYVFESENVNELGKTLSRVIENLDEAKSIAAEAKKYVYQTFSWDKIATETLAAYTATLSGQSRLGNRNED